MTLTDQITLTIGFFFVAGLCLFLSSFVAVKDLHAADGTATDGPALYKSLCNRCHGPLVERDASLKVRIIPVVMLPLGPDLKGVFGRPAGIVKGFQYSKSMRAFAATGAVWDRETLDLYLADSRKLVPGSYMFVKVPENQRAALIDYLETSAPYRP